MLIIELHPAFSWDCAECGRENFQRAISRFLDPEDPVEASIIREAHGIPEDEEIPPSRQCRVKTIPEKVICKHCQTPFLTTDTTPDSAGEDDDTADR